MPAKPERASPKRLHHRSPAATVRALVVLLRARAPRRDKGFADDIENGVRASNVPAEPGDPWTSSSTRASSSPPEGGLIDLDDVLQRRGTDFVALSAIGVAELHYGVIRRPARYRYRRGLCFSTARTVPGHSVRCRGSAGARIAAILSEKSGAALGHNDLLIASTAVAHDMAIAARDGDFARVSELTILNW